MGLKEVTRITRLMARVAKGPGTLPADHGVARTTERLGGCLTDRYDPTGAFRSSLVLIHGVSFKGKEDERLQHFATCLALEGVRCFAPTLPGLTRAISEVEDIDALGSLIQVASDEGRRAVGLVGFSYGGSAALLAAARPENAGLVEFVATFGAYHDLESCLTYYQEQDALRPAEGSRSRDSFLYQHLVYAHIWRERLGLSTQRIEALEQILKRYCDGASPQEKEDFFAQHLVDLDLVNRHCEWVDRSALRRITPAGQLQGLDCEVRLLHDPSDTMVPVTEAVALREAVEAVVGKARVKLLVTRLLSHVSIADVINPLTVPKLLAVLMPLVRSL